MGVARSQYFFATCNAPAGNEDISTFLATRNAIFCCRCRLQKWGVTREIFLATCLATFVARQVARKIAKCNMPFKLDVHATRMQRLASEDETALCASPFHGVVESHIHHGHHHVPVGLRI